MQTFLPYRDFTRSAACLDRQRLGKQRVEALSILRINLNLIDGGRWRNHPAVKMWQGYPLALATYGVAVCRQWRARGYVDRLLELFLATLKDRILRGESPEGQFPAPPWLGDEAFHRSHRAALLAKNPGWYGQFGWVETPQIKYVWPTKEGL